MKNDIPFYPDWRLLGYRYYPLGLAMRQHFGCPVWKVSIDAGFSCPNIDGTVGHGGCIFCNAASFSPSRRLCDSQTIEEQINFGIEHLKRRYTKAEKFIAYFQPSTNTYAPLKTLERVYRRALQHPNITGLTIGTRPDALPNGVLDLLAELSQTARVQLEIGLQSIHQKSLDFLQRGHSVETFFDAISRFSRRKKDRKNLFLGVHLILGLPTEQQRDVIATANKLAMLPLDSVKLHHLYAVRDTRLATLWGNGELILPSLEEYASLAVDFLERLPPNVIVERIAGEADSKYLIAPAWTSIKHCARNAIDQEFKRRNSRQGYHSPSFSTPYIDR